MEMEVRQGRELSHSIRAVIGDAAPGGGRADVAGVVVSQEGLDAHKLPGTEGGVFEVRNIPKSSALLF